MKTLLDSGTFSIVIERLAHQVMENHFDFSNTVIVGIQPRGIYLSDRLVGVLERETGTKISYGKLDITFYRDDIHQARQVLLPSQTDIPFSIEGRSVILVDDVLFTGRTIRSAMDALVDFGRPERVELLILVDRRFSRQLPIQPDYTGLVIDSMQSQKVKVYWKDHNGHDEIVMFDQQVQGI